MSYTSRKVFNSANVDALLPREMALACETAGAAKVARDEVALVVLGLPAAQWIRGQIGILPTPLYKQSALERMDRYEAQRRRRPQKPTGRKRNEESPEAFVNALHSQ